MPEIKLIAVKGFTQQDQKYPATNLLSGNVKDGKWLAHAKTTYMTATFQLEKCCIINKIDIGNSGSAFVKISVSRTGCDEAKILLPTSTLMTIPDSKAGRNKTCVKMYTNDDFIKETREQEWDVLHVFVNQQFNLHVPFGLSFIHVFNLKEEASASTSTIDDFLLRVQKNFTPKSSTPHSKFSGRISKTSSPLSQNPSKSNQVHEKEKLLDIEADEEDEAMFEASILSFMDSLDLQNNDLDSIKLADVREKMEALQNRIFSLHERKVFTNIVKKYVKSLQKSYAKNTSRFSSSNPNDIAHCSKDESPGVKATAFTVKSPSQYMKKNDKYVKPLQSSNAENISRPVSSSPIDIAHCSKDVSPGIKATTFMEKSPSQNMKKNGSWFDTSGWLSAKTDISTEASTSKVNSPSVRRNHISMEDCSDNHENTSHDKGDDRGAESLETSNYSKQQSMDSFISKSTFKRKHSIEDTTKKKLCAGDVINISDSEESETHETKSDSHHSNMVECPICKVLFEADVIEEHSSGCTEFVESSDSLIQDVTCPMCSEKINAFTADLHANKCASEMFGD